MHYDLDIPIHIPKQEVITRLRAVKCANGESPYQTSKITFEMLKPSSDYPLPCQLYLLESGLSRALELFIHPLDLWFTAGGWAFENYTYIPPIIEVVDGVSYIADGTHRMFKSRSLQTEMTVIIIEEPSVLYYAHPVSWDDVLIYTDNRVPYGTKKRLYRGPKEEAKLLYRNYNAVFPNTQPNRSTI